MRTINSSTQEMEVMYDFHDEPIILSKIVLDFFLKEEHPADLIALYSFYYYTAKWQKTNQPKATDKYCLQGLKIGYDRFKQAKDVLIQLKLIEVLQSRKNNRVDGWYIKVNFIWKSSSIHKNNDIDLELVEQGSEQELLFPRTRNQERNALSPNNINALNTNNLSSNFFETPINKEIKEHILPSQFEEFWKLYPKKIDKGKCLTKWESLCDRPSKTRPKWRIIKRAILTQKKTERWKNPKFIPHPITWLNQNRWLDDPSEMRLYNREADNKSNSIGYKEEKTTYQASGTW